MKRSYRHEDVILQAPAAAIVASSIIGLGGSVYAASEQSKAQKEAQRKQDEAERLAKIEADRIAAEARPEEEKATIAFGSGDKTEVGSANDFLTPRTKAGSSGLGGTSATGGLGFS